MQVDVRGRSFGDPYIHYGPRVRRSNMSDKVGLYIKT